MPYFQADKIYTVSQVPIVKGLVHCNQDGKILQVLNLEESQDIEPSEIQQLKGIIVPGFVNAHCHLELSHLHKQMPEHTGLIGFIKHLQQIRNQNLEQIEQAAIDWQQKMYDAGIVAVGDICNGTNSIKAKQHELLHYHNFIELFSFNPNKAMESMQHGLNLLNQFNDIALTNKYFNSSISPHAPYSTSLELIELIADASKNNSFPIFIHNQESIEEHNLYLNANGAFIDMLDTFGINTAHWEKKPLGSMLTVANLLHVNTKMLWVHNTFTNAAEINEVIKILPKSFFCLCPNANLFIENTLPDLNLFFDFKERVCIGTDSLASNQHLSILNEIQTIYKHANIDLNTLIQWATLNGAKALGFDAKLGSIEVGKTPGLNLLSTDNQKKKVEFVKKLI
ncbi:MAG TPA: amidohydrolase family protein [Bacteroidia bacterium]|nr:amidohydrolase family protein [Bacteroidia bacterium]